MARGSLTQEQCAEYASAAFTLATAMFDREEIDLLRRAAKEDRELDEHAFGRDRRRRRDGPAVAVEPPRRRHLRHVRPLRADGQLGRDSCSAARCTTTTRR